MNPEDFVSNWKDFNFPSYCSDIKVMYRFAKEFIETLKASLHDNLELVKFSSHIFSVSGYIQNKKTERLMFFTIDAADVRINNSWVDDIQVGEVMSLGDFFGRPAFYINYSDIPIVALLITTCSRNEDIDMFNRMTFKSDEYVVDGDNRYMKFSLGEVEDMVKEHDANIIKVTIQLKDVIYQPGGIVVVSMNDGKGEIKGRLDENSFHRLCLILNAPEEWLKSTSCAPELESVIMNTLIKTHAEYVNFRFSDIGLPISRALMPSRNTFFHSHLDFWLELSKIIKSSRFKDYDISFEKPNMGDEMGFWMVFNHKHDDPIKYIDNNSGYGIVELKPAIHFSHSEEGDEPIRISTGLFLSSSSRFVYFTNTKRYIHHLNESDLVEAYKLAKKAIVNILFHASDLDRNDNYLAPLLVLKILERRPRTHVTIRSDAIVNFDGTDIFNLYLYDGGCVLKHNGKLTRGIKQRINECFMVLDLPIVIYDKDGRLFVREFLQDDNFIDHQWLDNELNLSVYNYFW